MAFGARNNLVGPVGGAFYGPGGNPHCRPRNWFGLGDGAKRRLSSCVGRVGENGFCLRATEVFRDAALSEREEILHGALEALRREKEENGRVPRELLKKIVRLIEIDAWAARRVLQDFIGALRAERSEALPLFVKLKDYSNAKAT
ncbi:MAG: hypothetical protein QXH27_00560 [Candidatus Micrarchaeia archaeon]